MAEPNWPGTALAATPDPVQMLTQADACLIIGDNALLAAHDPAQEFQRLTGEVMVFALWVIRREFAERNPDGVRLVARLFQSSRDYAFAHPDELVAEALRRRNLPRAAVEEHFRRIRHHFAGPERRGLRRYLDLARKIGEIEAVPQLHVWGESGLEPQEPD